MPQSTRLFKRKEHHLPPASGDDTFNEDLPVVVLGHRAAMHPELYSNRVKTIYEGEIINSSYDGICFQSEKKFKPGTRILLKKADFKKISFSSKEFRRCHAVVKWCTQVEKTRPPCYHIGARRLREEKLPMINWKSAKFAPIKCF